MLNLHGFFFPFVSSFFSLSVLESNPWRDDTKPVYVLTHNENQLCTMKTRQNRRFNSDLFISVWRTFYIENNLSCLLYCAVKLKRNLDYCFPKGENEDWESEIRLNNQGAAPTLTCLLKILGRACLYVSMLCICCILLPLNRLYIRK